MSLLARLRKLVVKPTSGDVLGDAHDDGTDGPESTAPIVPEAVPLDERRDLHEIDEHLGKPYA